MKKLIAICAVALSASAFATDSYLYWMVDEAVTWADGTATSTPTYTAARVGYAAADGSGTTTYLTIYKASGSEVGDKLEFDSAYGSSAHYAGGIASTLQTTSYSFFIELLNDSTVVGTSEKLAGNALSSYLTSSMGGTNQPGEAWKGGTFTTAAIPEPTSGLLMLVGLAGLALRRKRMAKKA